MNGFESGRVVRTHRARDDVEKGLTTHGDPKAGLQITDQRDALMKSRRTSVPMKVGRRYRVLVVECGTHSLSTLTNF